MPIDTTIQPFIQRMLQQPDPEIAARAFQQGIAGFMGAYLNRKQSQRAEEQKAWDNFDWSDESASIPPKPSSPSGFERFASAYLSAPGVAAEGAMPFGSLRRKIFQSEANRLTIDESLDQNVIHELNKVGKLSVEEMPRWLIDHRAWLMTEKGRQVWLGVDKQWKETTSYQIQVAQSKADAEAMSEFPNVPLEQARVLRNKDRAIKQAYQEAHIAGLNPAGINEDLFDASGHMDPVKKSEWWGTLKPSVQIESRLAIAQAQIEANLIKTQAMLDMAEFRALHGGGYTPGSVEKDVTFIEGLKNLSEAEKKTAIARRLSLEAKPSAAASSGKTYYDNREFSALETERVNLQKALTELAGSDRKEDVAKRNELLGRRAEIDRRIRQMREAVTDVSGRIRVRSKKNPAHVGWALPSALASDPDLEEVK